MTLLALVRHGETDWNLQGRIQGTTDVPLNGTGIAQAAEVGRTLTVAPFVREWSGVITSPLARARKTGEVVASALGLPLLEPSPGLTERDYGRGEGMKIEEAKTLYPIGDYPESESNDLVLQRALASIRDISLQGPGLPLIVVSHGGLLHTLLSHLNGARVPSIMNATVNLIEFEPTLDQWLIHAINSEPHEIERLAKN